MGWAKANLSVKQFADATLHTNDNTTPATISAAGDKLTLAFASDFYTAGNISSVIGQCNIKIGDPVKRDLHLLPKQVIKIPVTNSSNYGKIQDYILVQLTWHFLSNLGQDYPNFLYLKFRCHFYNIESIYRLPIVYLI